MVCADEIDESPAPDPHGSGFLARVPGAAHTGAEGWTDRTDSCRTFLDWDALLKADRDGKDGSRFADLGTLALASSRKQAPRRVQMHDGQAQ